MKRIPHGLYATVFSVAALGLIVNMLLLVGALPLVFLLITTDPTKSWPLLAVALPLAAPALCGAFTAFREYGLGGLGPVRAFWQGVRAAGLRALGWGVAVTAVLVVLLVDVRALSGTEFAVVLVPLLLVLAVLVAAIGIVGLVAIAEVPGARFGEVLRSAAVLAVRRWWLTLATLVMLAVQFAVFTTAPALAIGITAAPVLYVAWSGSRYSLRPVLPAEPAPASV